MFLLDPHIWGSLFTLTVLEIVLGVDNLVMIAVVTHRLPEPMQPLARRMGLLLALIMRLALLGGLFWASHLQKTLFSVAGHPFSIRETIFFFGGLFLLIKGTQEIHAQFDVPTAHATANHMRSGYFYWAMIQIMLFDLIFSLDSVLTAIGLAEVYFIMALAVCIAIVLMMFAAEWLSHFIKTYPSFRTLAFSFILLVGVMLVADGMGAHIDRGYIYFAIAFSLFVEIINTLLRNRIHHRRAISEKIGA